MKKLPAHAIISKQELRIGTPSDKLGFFIKGVIVELDKIANSNSRNYTLLNEDDFNELINKYNAECRTCKFWELSEDDSRLRQTELGRCDHLDNDFCCGGSKEHEAGVTGGGNFVTKATFWCKFWEKK